MTTSVGFAFATMQRLFYVTTTSSVDLSSNPRSQRIMSVSARYPIDYLVNKFSYVINWVFHLFSEIWYFKSGYTKSYRHVSHVVWRILSCPPRSILNLRVILTTILCTYARVLPEFFPDHVYHPFHPSSLFHGTKCQYNIIFSYVLVNKDSNQYQSIHSCHKFYCDSTTYTKSFFLVH